MIPVLIGVLTSYIVANSLAISFFDVILQMKNLPFLPSLASAEFYNKSAGDLMNKKFLFITTQSKMSEIPVIMSKCGN